MHPGTPALAGVHQAAGVVAVDAADDQDHITTDGQILGGGLPVFGWLAHGVNPADLRVGEPLAEVADQLADPGHRLRGLRNDPIAGTFRKLVYLALRQHDVAPGVIFGESSNFDVVRLTNHQRMEPRCHEFLERLIGIAIPRIRDFRGISAKSFDGRGNFSMGVTEQIIFPEIDYDKIDALRGMDISIATTAKTDDEARALLLAFNFPFRG